MKKLCITVAKAVGFFVGWAVLTGLLPLPETENAAIWRFWAELIPFLSAAGWTVLFWLPEKRKLRLHLIASPLKSTLIGLGAGFLWLGSTAAVLLLPGDCGANGFRAETVVTYGLSPRDSITFSSLREPVLCVQRALPLLRGGVLEPQEFPLPGLAGAEGLLPCVSARLLWTGSPYPP